METFSTQIVADFAVIMTIAGMVVFLFHKLKQPLILGYLIAGVIIGPFTPPFSLVMRLDVLGAAAELGVILLLFGIGLEFPLAKLRRIGLKVPLGISAIEIALMFSISYGIGWILGWSFMDSLFLGAALTSSSTVVIAKVLTDFGKLKDTSALLMMGILVAEDIIVVLILALITSIAGASSLSLVGLTWTIGKALLFVLGVLIIGSRIVPRIIDWIARSEHNECLILIALGLCFGLSITAYLLGLSMAIGAFLAGILVASAKCAGKTASLIYPIKDMFAAMFFVSMGALINVTQFEVFLLPALLVTILMLAGKVFGCGLGTKVFGYDVSTSLRVGLGMGQIGEFAFIVMKVGQDMNVINPLLFPTVGVAAVITTFLTPYLVKLSYNIDMTQWRTKPKRSSNKSEDF
ncbi:MAG: cation:proton antiporter [Chloroflexi bacterium]|nr:cation:proton antiporter [Chloroflexota bacterium]